MTSTKSAFTIIATSGNFEIRQYRGSLGYQVWRSGSFFTFAPTLANAKAWL